MKITVTTAEPMLRRSVLIIIVLVVFMFSYGVTFTAIRYAQGDTNWFYIALPITSALSLILVWFYIMSYRWLTKANMNTILREMGFWLIDDVSEGRFTCVGDVKFFTSEDITAEQTKYKAVITGVNTAVVKKCFVVDWKPIFNTRSVNE